MPKLVGATVKRMTRRVIVTIVLCGLIAAAAIGLIMLIQNTEPTAQRGGATRKSAAIVDTFVVTNGAYQPVLVALGTVAPVRDIELRPQVAGRIEAVSDAFRPGGLVKAGEVLLSIEVDDFENAVAMRESALHQAEAQLAIEQGRRAVAEREFALLDEAINSTNRALVLREPQIAAARAEVQSARTAVAQARLDLERTRIRAPFDALIVSWNANVGSQVSPGDPVARLVGVDAYWVSTTIPLSELQRVQFAQQDGEGSTVQIRHRTAWAPGAYRDGYVESLIGTLDPETRLARVLVRVDDPLGADGDGPALILGTVVEARIAGREVRDVVRVARDYVRIGPSVWLYDNGELAIRDVELAFEDAQYAYIASGLKAGDEVVKTSLATVAPGIPLQRAGNHASPGSKDQP